MKTLLLGALAALAFAAAASAQTSPPLTDAQFVEKAVVGNRFEVESSRLAQSKLTDAKLKQFATMMVADHGKALEDLQSAAGGMKATLPDRLDVPHQTELDALKAKSGADFDAAYKADMKRGHTDTLALLQAHQRNARDTGIKAWIDKTLPVVQRHKDMIDRM